MTNSNFWKLAAIAFIGSVFYLGYRMQPSSEVQVPDILATAAADDQVAKDDSLQWVAVEGPAHMPRISRARVEGGWLVIARNDFKKQFGITFVPDHGHLWGQ